MNPYQVRSVCWPDQEFSVSHELCRGRQAATDLLGLLRQKMDMSTANADGLHLASGLVTMIIDSFSNSLSVLSSKDIGIVGRYRKISKSASLSSGDGKSHKPRKGVSWTQVTSDLTDDGYAWRKYGQKPILNAKHPRSYYKCTNKPHCQALKRVQKMDGDTPMYKITHTGYHTCENSSTSSSFSDMDSFFFNFEKEINEQSIKFSDRLNGSEESQNEQSELNLKKLPLMEHMETTSKSTKNVQWSSLDDFDYLIGSVEFKDFDTF